MGWHDNTDWVGWLVMAMVMLAFWGLVVLGVAVVFRDVGKSREPPHPPAPDALDVLAERFARGDIDAEEYLMRARVLRETTPGDHHPPATP